MKQYKRINCASSIILTAVSISSIVVSTRIVNIPRSIRLNVVYPLLTFLLVVSLALWIVSRNLRNKQERKGSLSDDKKGGSIK